MYIGQRMNQLQLKCLPFVSQQKWKVSSYFVCKDSREFPSVDCFCFECGLQMFNSVLQHCSTFLRKDDKIDLKAIKC